ncbi:type II secretion system minor pseudopilin GspH [Microbulbifer thermotolerans]|uniref:Type II secretion system protein H n=1 Tax=Microbulbifer thermotolerans TaxID=252514 RepID=A0AB35HTK8_MICTH|nr:type II secretion system minor pseudopilin GspH [Microbulbifer thermotolerans]MCX2800485.1 type II secretion system minor pseudopilin GspH [Microbulbifer thermotolerans]WKT58997.1 type II secretion system minor pseudopilin GspH [Microbulbifer thermotolerans]
MSRAAASWHPARQKGFTLIEVLVVIVIIATLAGMAGLSLGNSGARAWRSEVQRLAALLQLVADRALIDRAHYGVVIEPDGYAVVRFNSAQLQWETLEDSGTKSAARFVAHQLPDNMRLEVLEEAQMPVAAPAEFAAEEKSKKKQPSPHFVALSSGEILPVELAFYLLEDKDISRGAFISYNSLDGIKLEWQSDE